MPHFNRDTVASRERDESKPGIKTLRPFLEKLTVESDLENFQDLTVAFDAWPWAISCFSEDFICC